MSAPATVVRIPPADPAVSLVFYAPDGILASRLSAKLPAQVRLQWEDTHGHAPAQLAARPGVRCVLLDYSNAHAAHSSGIARQLQALRPELPLVAVGATTPEQVGGVLAALRAGVRDFIDIDTSPEEIQAALGRALAQSGSARLAPPAPLPKGRLVLVLGVRAGLGSSTLVAHLGVMAQLAGAAPAASAAAPQDPNRLLLLDLGYPAGDVGLYLNLDSSFHFEEALRNTGRIDPTLARTAMSRHRSGLALLGQAPGSAAATVAASDPRELLERLRSVFGLLLCDAGGLSCRQVPAALLRGADEIWLLADQAIATLVSLDQALKELEQAGLRDERLQLLVNRYDEASGIEPAQIAARFGLPLLATLPERSRSLRASASHGRLLQEEAPRDPYLRALAPLLARLSPDAAPPTTPNLWQRLAHRMSGFPWKTK